VTRLFAITSFLLGLLLAPDAWSALRTFLEPRLVDEMDTVRLTIRADGSSQSEAPDLTPLMDDFEVLGNQTSSRISSVNGRTLASVEYQISLRPRKTGELTVPRLKIGDEYSEEILLAVRPLDPQLKQTIANMVFFETELSNNPVYVQAETVLTRRLFYSQGVQIYSDLPGVPDVENAVVIPLGETQSRSVQRGGQRYGVIEQQFALFPEQSGKLTIPSISVTSSVRLQSAGRTRRSGIRVGTETIEVDVLSIPPGYPADSAWLPATDVSAKQNWEPTTGSVEVGEPLRFNVQIQASGNRGSAIPPTPLPLPEDSFKIYPEAPVMEETSDSGTINGLRRETYALIPTAPGQVSVPPLAITWWNTRTDSLERTTVPVKALRITGLATPQATAPTPESEDLQSQSAREDAADTPMETDRLILIAAGAVVIFAIFALIPWLARKYLPVWSQLLTRKTVNPDRRKLAGDLQAAARNPDPSAFRHALAEFLSVVYDTSQGDALERFRKHPGAREPLRLLDEAVYADVDAAASPPDLDTLLILARAAERSHRGHRSEAVLPALYA